MSNENVLIGKYFHSFTKDGGYKWQGQIIGNPSPNAYLVQLFEWFVGMESDQKIVPIGDMYSWVIYETAEDMQNAYRLGEAKKMRNE